MSLQHQHNNEIEEEEEEEEEALHNAALLEKLGKLRLFREELERKTQAVVALEHEKEEQEALLRPLLEQVEELKTLVTRQREQIEETHAQAEAAHAEEVAARSQLIEGEVAQLRAEVVRQKELGQALASVCKDYRRCQEHAEGFLTTLVRLSRRSNNGSAADGEVALQVEQQALLETFFFPPELAPLTSIATPQKKSSRRASKSTERPLWNCLRLLVEEVVRLLTEFKKAQSQRQRFLERLARAEMERDALTVRADGAMRELEETRAVAGSLQTLSLNLRDSLQDLESTRTELQAELLSRDEFLLSLAERMKVLSAIERDEEELEKESNKNPSPSRRRQSRPDNFSSSTSSMDSFVAVQNDIHAYLNHLLEKLKGMQAYYTQATQSSHQREADLSTLTKSLMEISEKNDEMAVAVDEHAKEAAEAKHLCAEQQEHLQLLADSLRKSERIVQEHAMDIQALQAENERMKTALAHVHAEREQERRQQETEKGDVVAWRRHAAKLQQEVTELREKSKAFWLSSSSLSSSSPAAAAMLMSSGMGSSSAGGHGRRFG